MNGSLAGQSQEARDPSEQILRLTTLIDVHFDDGSRSVGSGFFFQVLEPPDPQKSGPQWRTIKETYLVTNRHVVSPAKFDHVQKLVFHLRRAKPTGADWLPIEISREELGKRLHLHPKGEVDVAAVVVLDLIEKEIKSQVTDSSKGGVTDIIPWSAVSRDNFPGVSKLKVGTGDDLLMVGYVLIFSRANPLGKIGRLPKGTQTPVSKSLIF